MQFGTFQLVGGMGIGPLCSRACLPSLASGGGAVASCFPLDRHKDVMAKRQGKRKCPEIQAAIQLTKFGLLLTIMSSKREIAGAYK